jgi:hypothetical protein
MTGIKPDVARVTKDNLAVMFVGPLQAPYIETGVDHDSPTIQKPLETTTLQQAVRMVPRCAALVNRRTGEILRNLWVAPRTPAPTGKGCHRAQSRHGRRQSAAAPRSCASLTAPPRAADRCRRDAVIKVRSRSWRAGRPSGGARPTRARDPVVIRVLTCNENDAATRIR